MNEKKTQEKPTHTNSSIKEITAQNILLVGEIKSIQAVYEKKTPEKEFLTKNTYYTNLRTR